jgi:phosphate:Na+ symporter
MQSSHATLVLIITALASQQITYENALALAIGSNVGTTITAILGSISANINGKRLAAAHLVFNVATGVVAIVLIAQLIGAVDWLSSRLGIAENNHTMKLAVFHTLFNLLGITLMLPFIGKLGSVITKMLPEKQHEVAEPLYLNSAALEFPELALEAVRKETHNLYQYFFGILCHGLSFRVRDINSDVPVKEIIDSLKKPIPVNLKEEYTNKIKGLYAEIVNFIGKATENMSQEQNNEVFELRSAGRKMLESIKSTQQLHKNLSRYMNDTNPYIRNEYNKIRYRLGSILRSLSDMEKDTDDSRTALPTLEAMKVGIEEADHQFYIDIDQLIREKHITGAMATSLMNDNAYTNNIANNLLEIGTILFKSRDLEMHEVEQSLMLDEQETADAFENRKQKEEGSINCEDK